MKSALRRLANQASGKPPIPLGDGTRARRGLTFNLGAGKGDRETMLRQYGLSGTLYGIISLLAEASATPNWHLYKKPPVDGRRRYTTADQGSDQRIEVVQHAAIQLWNSPNDWHSRFEFAEGSQQHEELTGETFWVLDTETAGFPTSMWYVRPDRMEPVPDPDDYLLGWIYRGPNGESVPLKADEVILEKRPDPIDPYRGAGPVASIMPNIQQQRYATEYMRNTFLNGAQPDGVITVPNRLNDVQFDELIDRWREAHRGVARAGKVGVLEDGMTWAERKNTNRDLEYSNLRQANRDELREAWRIHKTMMGTADDVNRANAQTAQEVFVAWQILPRLNRRRDTLNSKLLPLFGAAGKGVEFDYEDPSPVNAETAANELLQKAQALQAIMDSGAEWHDALEAVGLPDMRQAAEAPPPAPVQPAREQITLRARPALTAAAQTTGTSQQPPNPQQLQAVDTQWKAAVAMLTAAWLATVLPRWNAELVTQTRDQVAKHNLIGLAALTLDTAVATQVIYEHIDAYAQAAARQAAAEAAAAGYPDTQPVAPAESDLQAAAAAASALAATQLALAAGREATRLASGPDPDPQAVADGVRDFLAGLSPASVTAMASGVMSMAQNQARLETIIAGPKCQLISSEMNDTTTCDPCEQISGTVFGDSDDPAAVIAARAAYPAGGYIACEGRERCRGTVFGLYQMAPSKKSAYVMPAVMASKDPSAKVYQQAAEDYPPQAMAWMHHAEWMGPVNAPLDHIDWTPYDMDGVDPAKVAMFVQKLRDGKKLKPVILVKTPGGDKLSLIDGHHRYLAAAELMQPVRAYVGTVDADEGPWDLMHEYQLGKRDVGRGTLAPDAVSASAGLSKAQVHYRDAEQNGPRCATCSMFRDPNACTLVKGLIRPDGLCDRWDAKPSAAALLRRVLTDGYAPVEFAQLTAGSR